MGEITRDEMQLEAAETWLNSDRRNTLLLGTGIGKSRVVILILKRLFDAKELTLKSKILLLVDSQKLRDDNWKAEFIKWECEWLWNIITAECYQTAYKWENTDWDLVIGDEIDFAFTDEYHKVFANNNIEMLLGITGFIDASKLVFLDSIAPVLMEYSTQSAQDDGLLNKTQLVLVEYNLSLDKNDILVEYLAKGKKRSFSQSENDAYDYLENQCNLLWGQVERLRSDQAVQFGLDDVKVAELSKLEFKYKMTKTKRMNMLYRNKSAVRAAKFVIDQILSAKGNKVLTFSSYTDQADAINEFTYHGKNKKNNTGLEDLSSGKIRSLGVCKAVNRGVNLDGVNKLVMESYNSSRTQFTQRHGRGCRLAADQTMYLYVLLPYYQKQTKSPENPGAYTTVRRPTQMVKWAIEMMEGFDFKNPIHLSITV